MTLEPAAPVVGFLANTTTASLRTLLVCALPSGSWARSSSMKTRLRLAPWLGPEAAGLTCHPAGKSLCASASATLRATTVRTLRSDPTRVSDDAIPTASGPSSSTRVNSSATVRNLMRAPLSGSAVGRLQVDADAAGASARERGKARHSAPRLTREMRTGPTLAVGGAHAGH